MKVSFLIVLLFLMAPAFAMECHPVDLSDKELTSWLDTLAEHVDPPPDLLEYCGDAGFSSLYKASWKAFETQHGWETTASVSCWTDVPGKPSTIFSCSRHITYRETETGSLVESKNLIGLDDVHSVVAAIKEQLGASEIISLDFVPVYCGKAWSVEDYGFEGSVILKEDEKKQMHFVVTKSCQPSPCVWEIESADAGAGRR